MQFRFQNWYSRVCGIGIELNANQNRYGPNSLGLESKLNVNAFAGILHHWFQRLQNHDQRVEYKRLTRKSIQGRKPENVN